MFILWEMKKQRNRKKQRQRNRKSWTSISGQGDSWGSGVLCYVGVTERTGFNTKDPMDKSPNQFKKQLPLNFKPFYSSRLTTNRKIIDPLEIKFIPTLLSTTT